MRESLKVFVSLLVFVSGLIGMDGVIEIPNSRYNTDGMNPAISLQFAGKAFAIDSELRLHLVVTPQEYIGPGLQAPAWMLHSFDSGKTWFQDYSTPSQCNWNDLTSDEEGNLYYVWHDASSGILFMKSADGGEHWSAPVTLVVEPPAEDSLLPVFPHYPSISATTGKLYVAWVCIPKGNSCISSATRRIMLMLSDNMGASWNPPMAICEDTVSIRGLEMDALGSRVSLIWPEVSTMNEYEYPANRTCYINSSDYGQTWTENRSPTGKDFKYNGDMYVGDDYNSLDLELGRTADYVVCDSTRITFVFSTKDRGWHWSKVRAIQPENEKENYGKTEFSTRDSVMAVLSCMDNKVLLEYSIDWGKTFNESMLLSKAPTNRIGDVGGTGDPRLAIDKYYRIHAVWSQILDSTAKVKAMFYYMQPTTGVVEEPVETVGRPLVFASANLFANRLDLKIVQDGPIYIAVYDASGRIVKNIATEGRRGSCLYWDGKDESAAMVPDGLYFIRARSGDRTELLKVIKLK